MKKFSKLISALCVVSLLLALVVMPVNASDTPINLFDESKLTNSGNANVIPTINGDGTYTVDYCYGGGFYGNINVELEAGKSYYVAVDARNSALNNYEGSTKKMKLQLGRGLVTGNISEITTLTDQWQRISRVITPTAETGTVKEHIGWGSIGTGHKMVIDYKNFVIYEMPGAFTVTTDFVSGTGNVGKSLKINYAFSNKLGRNLETTDFTLTGGKGRVSVVNGADGKSATVTLSDLDFESSYTLTLIGAKDYVEQALQDNIINFSTIADPTPVNIFDDKPVVYNDSTNVPVENGIYTVTRSINSSSGIYDTVIRINSIKLKPETQYIVSAYVRNGDDTVNSQWQAWFRDERGAQSTIPETRTTVRAGSDATQWHKVTGVYTTAAASSDVTIHAGLRLFGSADEQVILVKDLTLHEMPGEFTVTADKTSGMTNVPLTTSVTYKYSNMLSEPITTDNVVLNGGRGNVSVVTDELLMSSTVTLSNLEGEANYTLTLTGVKDYGNQTAPDNVITFTTMEDPNPAPLYYDDFEETSGFVNPDMVSIQPKISDGNASNGSETGNALQLKTTEYDFAKLTFDRPISGGIVDFSFDFYAEKGCPLMNVYFNNSIVNTSVYFDGIGLGDVIRGTIVPSVTTGVWHSVTYRVNFINRTYSVIFDGVVYTQDSYKRPLIFRDTNVSNVSVPSVNIFSGGGADKDLQIDNFKVVRYTNKDKLFLKFPGGTVDNDSLSVEGLETGMKISEIKSITSCEPAGAELVIRDKNGNDKIDSEVLEHTDSLFVMIKNDGVWKEYNLISGVTIDMQSVNIGGKEFFDSSKITIPGNAKVRAKITNDTLDEETLNVFAAVVGDKLYSVQMIPNLKFEAQENKDISLTVNIPDNKPDAKLKIMVTDAATLSPLTEYVSKLNVASQEISVPNIFSDHMVLQRNEEVNVFGLAPTGTNVSVTFGDYTVSGVAAGGQFLVKLPAMEATNVGKNLVLTVGDREFVYEDVVVGEVLYGSGQSNMQYVVRNISGAKKLGEIPNLRYFKVKELNTASDRIDKTPEESWVVSDSSTWLDNSATLYATAHALRKLGAISEDVPIGLINVSKGGTSIGAWVSPDVLEAGPYTSYYKNYLNGIFDPRMIQNTDLYSAMTQSVVPYTVKAAIWYQGENDTGVATYDWYLKAMVEEMRTLFGKEVPYYVVQLPGYSLGWEEIRLTQFKAHDPENGINVVVTNDTGESDDIHPQDKDVIGERIARHIASKTYGLNIPYSGPVYKSSSVSGSTVTVNFDFVNDGIHGDLCSIAEDESITTFELSEDGKNWYAANAVIDGETVKLTSSSVATPKFVRYAYVKLPLKSLGTNSNGVKLPLAPFSVEIQ